MVFVIIAMVVLMGAGGVIVYANTGNKKKKDALRKRRMAQVYEGISNFFLTEGYVANLRKRLANLSIYQKGELQAMTTKYFFISWGVSGALIIASVILFDDTVSILACVFFAIMLSTIIVDKQIDKTQAKVLKALKHALSGIRQEYLKTNSVVEAIEDVEVMPIIKKPLEEIASILTAVDGEIKLQEFCEATPYRTIQTLAEVSMQINNEGDEKDEYGHSNFMQSITLMLADINAEIEKTMFRKKVFGFVEYLPIVPILAIKPIQTFFTGIIPGTALIYNGVLGYVIQTAILVLSIIAYLTVTKINMDMAVKNDDRAVWVVNLLEKPFFNKIAQNLAPKNKSREKLIKKLKVALSRKTPEQLYFEKSLYFCVAFVLGLIMISSTVSMGKTYIENSTQQLSLVASSEMENYDQKQIKKMDEIYLANQDLYSTDEATLGLIDKHMQGLSDMQKQEQVKRLKSKAESIENAYFKWWYVWLAVGIATLGYFGPNMALTLRKVLIRTEEEDDFLQLQTLVTIYMNTSMDTLDVLGRLAQHSRIHKDMFLYAYHSYPSNPELEISRLQSKTALLDFKQFIGKFKLTITDLALKEAYSDLMLEREHMLKMREMAVKDSIEFKRFLCGPLAMSPLMLLIFGLFILPIGILGFSEIMNAINSM